MIIFDLLQETKAALAAYDRGDKWFPSTRQQVADLIAAVEEMQAKNEALGYELEHQHRELHRAER